MSSCKPCFIIPNYNHHLAFEQVVCSLLQHSIPIIIVNDGSNNLTRELLISIANQYVDIELIHLDSNQGKGAAVMAGLLFAHKKGYSHGFQVDADGQHNLEDILQFLKSSTEHPEQIICGVPVYDSSVPLGRLLPRYITHFWVWIETLSFQVKDSMCGFRIYPLKSTADVINNCRIGKRMDFDTEILVRLYWQNNEIQFLPTAVTYPEDGVSHFRLWEDNWLITKMHTRLFFEMLLRIPYLINRNFRRRQQRQSSEPHWGKQQEQGNLLGLKIMLTSYKLFGKRFFLYLLHPVIVFFTLFSTTQYQASKQYLQRQARYVKNDKTIGWKQVYKHFYEFGVSAIDKISSWMGDFPESEVTIHNNEFFDDIIEKKKGAIFIGSHLGNIELSRYLGFQRRSEIQLNALVYTKHAVKFQEVMSENAPDVKLNLIDVSNFGVDTTLLLQQKIEQGEIIIIVGDRTSVNNDSRVHSIDFLGEKAPFAEGPFILASILNCPVYLLFCHKEEGLYNIYLEKFADSLKFPRAMRNQLLAEKVQKYADRLAYYCNRAPYQWFNFYDFWKAEQK